MDTSVQLLDNTNYEFHELIVEKKMLSLSLCEFFMETEFDLNMHFTSTFWFTLNQLNDNDWFEVTDDIIEKIGFKGDIKKSNQRTHLFECIKKHFIENVDYTLSIDETIIKSGRGGHNKKTLHMKRDTFKKLLLKVNTKNSDQIFDFLISFEKHVIKYIRYQRECLTYQSMQEIKQHSQTATVSTLNVVQENMLRNILEQEEIYIMTSIELAQDFIFKVGRSKNSFTRLQTMNTGLKVNYTLLMYQNAMTTKIVRIIYIRYSLSFVYVKNANSFNVRSTSLSVSLTVCVIHLITTTQKSLN